MAPVIVITSTKTLNTSEMNLQKLSFLPWGVEEKNGVWGRDEAKLLF